MTDTPQLPISTTSAVPCIGKRLQAALRTLDGFSDGAIQGFFTYAHSIERLYVQDDRLSLSREQLAAIKYLKDCPYDLILSWRSRLLQTDHGSPDQSKERFYGSAPQYSNGYDTLSSHRPYPAGSDDISKALVPVKSNSPGIQARDSSLDISVPSDAHQGDKISPSDEGVQATCWCTYCARSFRTKDGWSRHEKEDHENHVYSCMPTGPVEIRGRGVECSICRAPNPDEGHLNMHQLARCLEKSVSDREYKRRNDLVSHLRSHGVSNGLDLAKRWRRNPNRKAWACGFCVTLFSQRMDRINHIYNQHWTDGMNMNHWNPSMVIQGLLLQPLLSSKWSEFLSKGYMLDTSKITWHSSVIDALQRRLEVAEEAPESLVAAAYALSSLGQSRFDADMQAPRRCWGTGSLDCHANRPRHGDVECYEKLYSFDMSHQALRPEATRPSLSSIGQVNPNFHSPIGDLPSETDWIGDHATAWYGLGVFNP